VGKGAAAFLITLVIAVPFVVLNIYVIGRMFSGGGSPALFLLNIPLAILAFIWLTPPSWLGDPMAKGPGLLQWALNYLR
jgi:hypothetical protein